MFPHHDHFVNPFAADAKPGLLFKKIIFRNPCDRRDVIEFMIKFAVGETFSPTSELTQMSPNGPKTDPSLTVN